jgi:hypothetical protein
MEALTAFNANLHPAPAAPRLPRPAHATAVVAAFYILMALAAPWIVRYAPGSESSVAAQIAERPVPMRCASAPEYGLPCGSPAPGAASVAARV